MCWILRVVQKVRQMVITNWREWQIFKTDNKFMKLGVLKIENIMKKTSNWRKLNKQKMAIEKLIGTIEKFEKEYWVS